MELFLKRLWSDATQYGQTASWTEGGVFAFGHFRPPFGSGGCDFNLKFTGLTHNFSVDPAV